MSSLSAVVMTVVEALECGKIGMNKLIAVIHGQNTTDADAYVAYVAV